MWTVDREEIVDGATYYVVAAGTTREIYYRKTDFASSMEKVNGQIEVRHTPPSLRLPWPPWPGEKIEERYTRERPGARQSESDDCVRVGSGRDGRCPGGVIRNGKGHVA